MNCSATSALGARRTIAVSAGVLVLGTLSGVDASAQSLERNSCVKGPSERIIEIRYGGTGMLPCEVWYGPAGQLRRQAASRGTPGVCEPVARNIAANLAKDGFSCSAAQAREPPGGSADTLPPTREDELVQAGKAVVETCLSRLGQVDDKCETPPFKVKVVGKATTPMTLDGADVAVLVMQVHSAPGDRPDWGGHFLVSQAGPPTIRVIAEAYEEFESVRSVDLNDDGRTEVMIFTHTTPRQGRSTTSFAVIGGARTLGYASAFEASGQAHEAYVLESRTGGYRDVIALTGDAVFECRYQSGYQCRKLMALAVERPR